MRLALLATLAITTMLVTDVALSHPEVRPDVLRPNRPGPSRPDHGRPDNGRPNRPGRPDHGRPDHGRDAYSVIFCQDTSSPCRKWNSYGAGNARSRATHWNFSGNYRYDVRECDYMAQTFRGSKHGTTGKINAHMLSDGYYNPITSPRKLTGATMDILNYCRQLVRQMSR